MELKVIFFLVLIFFVGGSLYYLRYREADLHAEKYDYSLEDSLFINAGNDEISDKSGDKNIEKRVDSDRELLDFRTHELSGGENSVGDLSEKVNINIASMEILMQLPGIGEKTAEKIIAYRNQNNGFKAISDLMLVKGIGEAKFDRIKNFIIIE